MLENKSLWLAPPATDTRKRAILDPATRHPLGLARWRPAPASWLRWLARPTLDVFETEDESLLFTVRKWPLFSGWVVSDADGRHVGSIVGRTVIDHYGRRLAALERPINGRPARMLATDGTELAALADTGDGAVISFGDRLENPFARMLLLAALLGAEKSR